MVGFGSVYRMSRRRGWEDAYFDYETLKLLLTQIEAVYEENTGASGDIHYAVAGLSAFGSEDVFDVRYGDQFDERLQASGDSRRRQRRQKKKRKSESEDIKPVDWRDELFVESDSSVAFASSEDDSEEESYSDTINHGETSSLLSPKFNFSYGGNSAGVPSYGSSNSFVIGVGASASGTISNDSRTSLDNQKNGAALGESQPMLSYSQSGRAIMDAQRLKGDDVNKKKSKYQKRKKRLWKKRRTTPPHLKRAHEKARAITGRFLGLLRAEIDKVSLFVHSRMGELTDTIGSLRFPSDTLDFDNEYRHQLSDGGIHPSASSSSEDSSTSSVEASSDLEDMKPDSKLFPKRRGIKRCSDIMGSSFMHQSFEGFFDQQSAKSTTLRQLRLAEHLRMTRPIFRSDQVLGEDFLLLSAVDEADAFAAVGVEFLHLLRFICINAIAIRKLCKKHDRLLSNRMLGGYYHKLHNKPEHEDYEVPKSGNDFESTPRRNNTTFHKSSNRTLNGYRSTINVKSRKKERNNMLLGTYDSQVQALANSLVANTLFNNLGLALTEFEISRRRADRLSNIPIKKSNVASHETYADVVEPDDLCYGFPSPKTFGFASRRKRDDFREELKQDDEKSDAQSTSSSISLARLRFIVTSVETLRQAAVEERNTFSEYLARSVLVLDGQNFVGEPKGLNGGCSRNTLEFLASYNPDLILVIDPQVLQEALTKQDHLQSISCSADGVESLDRTSVPRHTRKRSNTDQNMSVALAGLPSQTSFRRPSELVKLHKIRSLNLCFAFLSTMNYYIILPSAASFCGELGWKHAYAAWLIGVWNISALIFLFYGSYHWFCLQPMSRNCYVKAIFTFGCVCSFLGNMLYAKAYEHGSFIIAILGRLLTGFSSMEVINKNMVMHYQINDGTQTEITVLKLLQMVGMVMGMLIGSLDFETRSFVIMGDHFTVSFQTLPAYIMSIAWGFFIVPLMIVDFQVMSYTKKVSEMKNDTSLSASDHEERNDKDYLLPSIMTRFPSESTIGPEKIDEEGLPISLRSHVRSVVAVLRQTHRLVMYNIAVPITLLLYAFVSMAKEIIFNLSVIIGIRYFQWSGGYSGLALCCLAVTTVPMYWVMSHLNSWIEERFLIKKSIKIMLLGILCIFNYQALYILSKDIQHIFSMRSTDGPLATYYNWDYGVIFYWASAAIIFASSTALEGLSLSLLSKLSPTKLNDSPMNCSVLAPFVGCLGRLVGDAMIVIVGYSHRIVDTDMVNSIAFILLGLCLCCLHMLRKNFFFFNGLYRLHSN